MTDEPEQGIQFICFGCPGQFDFQGTGAFACQEIQGGGLLHLQETGQLHRLGGRYQDAFLQSRQTAHHEGHLFFKSKLYGFIKFIQHQGVDGVGFNVLATDMIPQTAWCAHNNSRGFE